MIRRARSFPAAALVVGALACGKESVRASPDAPGDPPAQAEDDDEREVGVAGSEGEGDDPVIAPSGGASGAAGLFAEAEHVLTTMTHSTYSHKTRVQGTSYDVDCSGFVDVLLARVDPPGLEEVRAATVRRPLARHFVQFFRAPSGARWHAVGRVADLGPGDLLAWTKPADVTSSNTGHVMVVAGPPRASGGAWVVPVIDSSASPHGRGDSRKAAHATGIGKGTVVLDVDPAGRPVGYRWSEWKKSRAHPTEIAMGRLR